jgi:drug/metabolite transporter (DMT)-like permease
LLSVVFAIAFLGERATLREVAGIALAAAGVLAMILLAPAERAGDEPLEAAYQRLL